MKITLLSNWHRWRKEQGMFIFIGAQWGEDDYTTARYLEFTFCNFGILLKWGSTFALRQETRRERENE